MDPLKLTKFTLTTQRDLDPDDERTPIRFLLAMDGRSIGNKHHSIAFNIIPMHTSQSKLFKSANVHPVSAQSHEDTHELHECFFFFLLLNAPA